MYDRIQASVYHDPSLQNLYVYRLKKTKTKMFSKMLTKAKQVKLKLVQFNPKRHQKNCQMKLWKKSSKISTTTITLERFPMDSQVLRFYYFYFMQITQIKVCKYLHMFVLHYYFQQFHICCIQGNIKNVFSLFPQLHHKLEKIQRSNFVSVL